MHATICNISRIVEKKPRDVFIVDIAAFPTLHVRDVAMQSAFVRGLRRIRKEAKLGKAISAWHQVIIAVYATTRVLQASKAT
jgi:hypothetical protein